VCWLVVVQEVELVRVEVKLWRESLIVKRGNDRIVRLNERPDSDVNVSRGDSHEFGVM
jgi:hypothetical protein